MGMTMREQLDKFKLGAAAEGIKGGAFFRDKIREPTWYKTPEAIGFMVLAVIIVAVSIIIIVKRGS